MLYTNIILGLLALALSGVSSAFPVDDPAPTEVPTLIARAPLSISAQSPTALTATSSATGENAAEDAEDAVPTATVRMGSTKFRRGSKVANKYTVYLKGDADVAAHIDTVEAFQPPAGKKLKVRTKIIGSPIDLRLANPPIWIYTAVLDKLVVAAVKADPNFWQIDKATSIGADGDDGEDGGEAAEN